MMRAFNNNMARCVVGYGGGSGGGGIGEGGGLYDTYHRYCCITFCTHLFYYILSSNITIYFILLCVWDSL